MFIRVLSLAEKIEASFHKEAVDIFESESQRSAYQPGDLVAYRRQEATYISQIAPGQALIHLSGTRKTDFIQVNESDLKLLEQRQQRKIRKDYTQTNQPAYTPPPRVEPEKKEEDLFTFMEPERKELSDWDLYRLETRAMLSRGK